MIELKSPHLEPAEQIQSKDIAVLMNPVPRNHIGTLFGPRCTLFNSVFHGAFNGSYHGHPDVLKLISFRRQRRDEVKHACFRKYFFGFFLFLCYVM
jgi:hypothetical protein